MDKAEQMQAAEKHALVQTTNTSGWRLVVRIAEEISREFQVKVLACKKREEMPDLVLQAQAASEFWGAVINRIDQQKFVDAGPDPKFEPLEDF